MRKIEKPELISTIRDKKSLVKHKRISSYVYVSS